MRTLVIGGTRFLGRAIVERLLANGHEVTLLNRGESGPALFPDVPRLTMDRAAISADALGAGAWDAAIDTCAYYPGEIEQTVAALRGKVGRYALVSTGSVYPELRPYPLREDGPMAECTPEQARDTSMETYGARKAECERVLRRLGAEAGMTVFIGRPTVVYGPHDYTDRLHFYLESVRRGRVTLPDDGMSVFHLIYAPDLAWLFVRMTEAPADLAGVYNVAATELYSLRELVNEAAKVIGVEPEIAYAPASLLERHGIQPQFNLPLWIPGEHVIKDVSRAQLLLGFRSTPFAETLRATLAAYLEQPRAPLLAVTDPDRLWAIAHGEAD